MTTTAYRESELELTSYFTSSLGVGAQNYDACGGTALFDSNEAVARMAFGPQRGAVRAHLTIERTLERIEPAHRHTLALRYYPRRVGNGAYMAALGELSVLGMLTPAATNAFRKWQDLSPKRLATSIVTWLDDEARHGSGAARRDTIETQARDRLTVALACYDVARVARCRAEAEAKRAAEEAEQASNEAALGGPVRVTTAPASVTRLRAPRVRQALQEAADAVAALLAEHADLLGAEAS